MFIEHTLIHEMSTPSGVMGRLESISIGTRKTIMQKALDAFTNFSPSGTSLEELARPILEVLEASLGLESTYLTSVNEIDGMQSVLFSRNTRQLEIPEGVSFDWGDTLCKRALEQGESWVSDVPQLWSDSAAAKALGIMTYVSSPIFIGEGELVGTLCGASMEKIPANSQALNVLNMFALMVGQRLEQERQIDRLQQENRELSAQVMVDGLTGLPNRRAVQEELSRELFRAGRSGKNVVVAFIDLDGFKAINDQYGHAAGDRFLADVGRRLELGLRAGDFAARYGGDEFIVIAPNANSDDASHIAERLNSLLVGKYNIGSLAIHYGGASIGVVSAGAGHNVAEVIRMADAAMYEVKSKRRGADTPL